MSFLSLIRWGGAAQSTYAPEDTSHVLIWDPPWLVEEGSGDWELQTRADFDAGTPRDTWASPGLPIWADTEALAAWAAEQLGYPVTLTRDIQEIRLDHEQTWHVEPIFWVVPA